MNFGSSHFGSGFFGSSEQETNNAFSTFDLVSATANNAEFVDLIFSAVLNTGLAALTDATSYTINNGDVSVAFVTVLSVYSVRIHVAEPIRQNVQYTIQVSTNVTGVSGELLNENTATFIWRVPVQKARRVNSAQYFNPGFGIESEVFSDG